MSDTEPTVPGFAGAPEGTGRTLWRKRSSRRGWPSLAFIFVSLAAVLVGILVVVAAHEASGYFLFSPGTAPVITANSDCKSSQGELALPNGTPCVRLVLPKAKSHRVDGKLLMVDVEVGQAGPLDWAEYELGLLGRQRQLVPVVDYTGSTPTSELGCQDTQQMVSANQDAAITALERLHYSVPEDPLGAEITTVYGGTTAWATGIKCDDMITAVDGKAVRDAPAFTALLKPMAPGTTVTLTDHPASGGAAKLIKVRLVRPTPSMVEEGFTCAACLGVSVETRIKPELPFPVSVDAGDIGGPSAGLAFTLAILDALSNGKLTGGHTVAATGTIATNGDVGQVGGVQEKTAAVEKAGAQVFFVPEAEYSDAKSVADDKLQVVPVTTLQQVLDLLHQRYGGSLPGLTGGSQA